MYYDEDFLVSFSCLPVPSGSGKAFLFLVGFGHYTVIDMPKDAYHDYTNNTVQVGDEGSADRA